MISFKIYSPNVLKPKIIIKSSFLILNSIYDSSFLSYGKDKKKEIQPFVIIRIIWKYKKRIIWR